MFDFFNGVDFYSPRASTISLKDSSGPSSPIYKNLQLSDAAVAFGFRQQILKSLDVSLEEGVFVGAFLNWFTRHYKIVHKCVLGSVSEPGPQFIYLYCFSNQFRYEPEDPAHGELEDERIFHKVNGELWVIDLKKPHLYFSQATAFHSSASILNNVSNGLTHFQFCRGSLPLELTLQGLYLNLNFWTSWKTGDPWGSLMSFLIYLRHRMSPSGRHRLEGLNMQSAMQLLGSRSVGPFQSLPEAELLKILQEYNRQLRTRIGEALKLEETTAYRRFEQSSNPANS
jgi:hypothetical protein